MFEEADHIADLFRGGLPYYLLLALPILIICSSNPVLASSEFTVQRMSQFDVNGVTYGCRASALSLEAKSLYTWSTNRHCVVAKLQDITIDQFNAIRQKAGGLVVLLPKDVTAMNAEQKEYLYLLEQSMLAQPSSIPVYFSSYNDELEQVVEDISRTSADNNDQSVKPGGQRNSALSELFASISANGYQIIVSKSSHSANKNSKIPIIQGELAPSRVTKQGDQNSGVEPNSKLPMIIVTAHLNSFGLYNEYPYNSDAAILLTVADAFSKLHNMPNAASKYRLMFLLTESGALLNFQGVKKWLDENVQLQNVDFVICLDTMSQGMNGLQDELFMHVSKPPKEGTAMNNFYQLLKSADSKYENMTVKGVHKKINLADQQLAWEHERFSMRRLPAFTVSSLKSPTEAIRTTIFKDSEAQLIADAQRKAKFLSEALARFVYNTDENNEIFSGAFDINKTLLKSYLNLKSALHNNDLKNAFEKYLKNVKVLFDKPDAVEPDFMFYDGQEASLNVYRVKPAVFDLFLTIFISAYLGSVYLFITNFHALYDLVCKITKNQSSSNGSFANSNNYNERLKSKMS